MCYRELFSKMLLPSMAICPRDCGHVDRFGWSLRTGGHDLHNHLHGHEFRSPSFQSSGRGKHTAGSGDLEGRRQERRCPNTFDSDQGGTGITTTTNALSQIWEYGTIQTPTLDLAVPINQALDSHFLVNLGNLLIVHNPNEDFVANPLYDPWGGFGTYLRGTFSILSTSSTSWDFAYLVVPNNTTVNLDFHIGGFIPGVPYNQPVSSDYVSGSITVTPEPSTLVLLGSGILGLLVYRQAARTG